jgi:chemotaxis signal transduction protein
MKSTDAAGREGPGRRGSAEPVPLASLASDQRVIDEVYRRRALRLAARRPAETVSATLPVLIVGVGPERYAIELSALAEVFPYRSCTTVPGAPPALLGVINVRGDIRAVADLRRLLGLTPGEDTPAGYVVMLRHTGSAMGLRVDRIEQVRQVDPVQLLPGTDGAAPIHGSRFVKALTADTVMLLDAGAVLSHLVPTTT